jgi:hypothetical protein
MSDYEIMCRASSEFRPVEFDNFHQETCHEAPYLLKTLSNDQFSL